MYFHILNATVIRKEERLMFQRHSARARIRESKRSSASYSKLVKSTAFPYFSSSPFPSAIYPPGVGFPYHDLAPRTASVFIASCRQVNRRSEKERDYERRRKVDEEEGSESREDYTRSARGAHPSLPGLLSAFNQRLC